MIHRDRYYSRPPHQRQRGFSLLEALVAFVILAGGLMVLFRFHTTSVQSTADSKIRAEALALGEAKMEEVRSFLSATGYDARMVANDGSDSSTSLGDYASGVDFAASFTRAWSVDTTTNPDSITVVVSWTDRTAVADADGVIPQENITLTSMVLREEPDAGARNLQAVLAGNGDPGGGIVAPSSMGTGQGTGTVVVTLHGDDGNEYASVDAIPDGVIILTYDINFTGYVDATNALLSSVTLTGDAGTTGIPSCSGALGDPTATAVLDIADGTQTDAGGTPYTIGTLLDRNGVPTPADEDPYRYTCSILGIDHNETWTGLIVYEGVGNDEVCIPNTGSTELIFSEQTPSVVQLGIVILTNQGACAVL